jgi:predicted acyl esterase
LNAGQAVELKLDLYPTSYVFQKGHRIRLTLNFADARATQKLDPAPQVTVYHGGKYASELVLPLIPSHGT